MTTQKPREVPECHTIYEQNMRRDRELEARSHEQQAPKSLRPVLQEEHHDIIQALRLELVEKAKKLEMQGKSSQSRKFVLTASILQFMLAQFETKQKNP